MLRHRLHRTILGTLAVGAAALAVAGCGSDSSGSSSGDSTPPPAAAPTATTPAPTVAATTTTETNGTGGATAGAPVEIDMTGLKFAPAGATVKVGDVVTWTNQDSVAHNVTSSDGAIKSSNFGKGETFSWTAVKKGTISYSCTLHPGMNGTLNVE